MYYNYPTGFIRQDFKEVSKRYIDHCRIPPPMTCYQKQSLLVAMGQAGFMTTLAVHTVEEKVITKNKGR